MLLLISLLAFITVFVLLYLLLNTVLPDDMVQMRLKSLDNITGGRTDLDDALKESFGLRILGPLIHLLGKRLYGVAPAALRQMLEEKIMMAGGFGNLSVNEFLLLNVFLALALPAIVASLLFLTSAPAQRIIGLSVFACVLGMAVPLLLLNQKIGKRKKSMQRDLPDVLDLLTVSVEAGLGFDGALAKLSEKMKGALVEEFSRVLQEIRIGVTRRDALASMGARCEVPDLSLFTTSLLQADQLGVSIGNVLRVQSESMREKRRQRAEEKAMKAPIKMMLPLVLFIFPCIFIVLLGPAIIQVITTFMNR
jgi:tight adherence protein C